MDTSQYERFAKIDGLHWWFRSRREIVDRIVKTLTLPLDAELLDIGTGTGGMLPILTKYGKVSAFEPDAETLSFTRSRHANSVSAFYGGDWNSLNLALNNFDLVTAFDVLEHTEDDVQTLKSWCGLLKGSGQLLLTVPAFPCLWGQNDVLSHHYRRYTKRTLRACLETAGFHIQKISYINALNFGPVWLSRNVKERIDRLVRSNNTSSPWDFSLPPKPINSLLQCSFAWEKHVLPMIDLPIGTSLLCVASPTTHRMARGNRAAVVAAIGPR